MPQESTGSQKQPQPEQGSDGRSADTTEMSKIDLQALAERVLKLLKEEARLERERLGRRYL